MHTTTQWWKILIGIALVAALVLVYQRHMVEIANNTVELAIDYDDIANTAMQEGIDTLAYMEKLRDAGVTSVAVYDATLEKLVRYGRVSVFPGATLLNEYRLGGARYGIIQKLAQDSKIVPEYSYVVAPSTPDMAELEADLVRRLGGDRVERLTGDGLTVLGVKSDYDKLMRLNLGLPSYELRAAASKGLYILARPSNYHNVHPEDVNAVFGRLKPFDKVSTMVFTGEEALGYPQILPLTAKLLQERNMALGLIEHTTQLQFLRQEGSEVLSKLLNYQIARLYAIPRDEQLKLKIGEAAQRWVLSNRERNIRINLLRAYLKPEARMTLAETNVAYVSTVRSALEGAGYTVGKASTFAPHFPARPLLALTLAGVIAGMMLLLGKFINLSKRWQALLFAGAVVLGVVPLVLGAGETIRLAAALAAANIFPVLAMAWQLERWEENEGRVMSVPKTIVNGTLQLVAAVLISLIGGMFVAALLSDVRYLLELNIFRGVKLTFVLPLVLTLLLYLKKFNVFEGERVTGIFAQTKEILKQPVFVVTMLAMFAGFLVLIIFIGRSGHTAGIPVPDIELKLRAFLEQVMYARPREKEFLFGHPAFMLAVLAVFRKWPRWLQCMLAVAAVIAQGSLVETFAHLRTPVWMSFVRAVDGVVLGVILGAVAVIAAVTLHRLWRAMERRNIKHV